MLLVFTQQKCGAEQVMIIMNPATGRNQTWTPADTTEARGGDACVAPLLALIASFSCCRLLVALSHGGPRFTDACPPLRCERAGVLPHGGSAAGVALLEGALASSAAQLPGATPGTCLSGYILLHDCAWLLLAGACRRPLLPDPMPACPPLTVCPLVAAVRPRVQLPHRHWLPLHELRPVAEVRCQPHASLRRRTAFAFAGRRCELTKESYSSRSNLGQVCRAILMMYA